VHTILNRILLLIALSLISLDFVWVIHGHVAVDARNYVLLLGLVLPLAGGAIFYEHVRADASLSAVLAGAAFLLLFSASCSLLSYLLLTVAGTRIDNQLAAIDSAFGFHWPDLMMFAANHKLLTFFLGLAYLSVMPQTVALLLILGWKQRGADIYGFCLAIALGGLIAVSVWAIHPSFGAFSVFNLPHWAEKNLGLALDGDYGRDLILLLKNGPGFISPADLRGIVGFPSYHTVQALVLIWYARNLRVVRWIAVALNIAVLIATPIHGGHHLIDLAGGAVVAAAAIALSDWIVRRASVRAGNAALPSTAAQPAL